MSEGILVAADTKYKTVSRFVKLKIMTGVLPVIEKV